MKKNNEIHDEPNRKLLLDSAISNLQYCYNEYEKIQIKNIENWFITDKGEHAYLGDIKSMYDKEYDLKKKYEQAHEEVIRLKVVYGEMEE